MFEIMDNHANEAVIKVVGVGGGGGNAVQHMVEQTIEGVEFIAANTDAQALRSSNANVTLQIGMNVTKGLGAGANPEVGREAALEDKDKIRESLDGADMIFIACGMGGGTGTGAAPVIAEVARDLGILTVAVVTKPFPFEGRKRMAYADQGIEHLAKQVDSLITIPNEKLLKVLGKGTTLLDAFKAANNVLLGAVQGIAELITRPGLINVDFADVKTVMSEMGTAMMGTGVARGDERAQEAAVQAISSPLLEDVDLTGARGILVNITAGMDLAIDEFETVGNSVKALASDNATVVVGTVIDPEMSEEMRVTVVATGIGAEVKPDIKLVQAGNTPTQSVPVTAPRPAAQAPAPEAVARNLVSGATLHSGTTSVMPDYKTLEQPATARPVSGSVSNGSNPGSREGASSTEKGMDYLDIPAFLRRQAD